MMLTEIDSMIESIGLPYAYYQFPGNQEPPFICFYYPYDNDLIADCINYARINSVIIELYTTNKDFDSEAAVENVLIEKGLAFSKTEAYIESEHMFQITYTTEVVINVEQD